MCIAKDLNFFITDEKLACISKPFIGVVLPIDDQNLKTLPAKRFQVIDTWIHILVKVQPANDSIDLELDAVLEAEISDLIKIWNLVAGAPANLGVGMFIERITGNGENIDIVPMLGEEIPGD